MTEKRYIKLLLWSVGLGEMEKCEKAADALIAKGFRKQSEVADSIFGEIYQILADADLKYETASEEGNPAVNYIFNAVVALKNKYKGGATDENL